MIDKAFNLLKKSIKLIILLFIGSIILTIIFQSNNTNKPTITNITANQTTNNTEAPPKPKEKVYGTIGQKLSISNNMAITLLSISRKPNKTTLGAKANHELIQAEVLIENIGSSTIGVNPLNASIKDQEGHKYDYAMFAENSLKAENISSGEKSKGNITFEVPQGSKNYVFKYEELVCFSCPPFEFKFE